MAKIKKYFKEVLTKIKNNYIDFWAPACIFIQIGGFLFFWWLIKNPFEAFATTFVLVPAVFAIIMIAGFLSFIPFLNWGIAIMAVGYYGDPVIDFLYLFIPTEYEILFSFLISLCFFIINCLCVYEGFKRDELNRKIEEE